MRTSVIAYDLNKAILIFLVIITFVFVAGALYVMVDVLPGKSVPLLSGLVAGMILLTAILTWQPKVALPLLIVSVFFSPDIVVAQIPGHPVNLRIEDGIIVAALLGLLIRYAAGREKISIRTPLDKPILAYCAVGLASTLVGIYLGNVPALRGLFFFAKWVEYFLLFYLLCHCLEGKKEMKTAIYLVFVCIFIVSVYNAYMRLTVGAVERYRAFGPPGNLDRSNEYGELLVLILPIVVAIAVANRSFLHISAAAIGGPFMMYFLLDTERRVAFVGASVALLFIAIYRYRFLLALWAGIVCYSAARLPERMVYRIKYLWVEISHLDAWRGLPIAEVGSGSFYLRVQGAKRALANLLYRPLIGRGIGTHLLDIDITHNQYAQLLSELGILGTAAFFWFILSISRLCWRGIKMDTDNMLRGYCIGFLAGLIGFCVMALGAIVFTSIRTMEFFMVMTAVLTACVESELRIEDNPRIPLV